LMYMQHCEIQKQPFKSYLEINQHEINPLMRSILIDWMVEVSDEYKFQPETLMLSIAFLDRFLSKDFAKHLKCSKLQLVGITAMLIASKIEELHAPSVDDFIYISENLYHRNEILAMEWLVLETFLYETIQPTIWTFLPFIIKANHRFTRKQEELIILLSAYLAELAISDYLIATTFLPSLIASSCLLLSNFILFIDKPSWSLTLQIASGNYRPSILYKCCTFIYNKLRKISTTGITSSIYHKYSMVKFKSISNNIDIKQCLETFFDLPDYIFVDTIESYIKTIWL